MVHPAGCMTVARLNVLAQEPGIPLFSTERNRCDGDPVTTLRRVCVSGRTHIRERNKCSRCGRVHARGIRAVPEETGESEG